MKKLQKNETKIGQTEKLNELQKQNQKTESLKPLNPETN